MKCSFKGCNGKVRNINDSETKREYVCFKCKRVRTIYIKEKGGERK